MSDQKIIDYIQRSLNARSPYDDTTKNSLYHAGFLAAFIANEVLRDSHVLERFKRAVALNGPAAKSQNKG
jgi:hypothetical protein